MNPTPLLTVRTLVYNHEPYLRDCLEGIVRQKTNFPFIAIVHDDASTDHSADIIREYAERYPHIIRPIFETENQYNKGTLASIMADAVPPETKYVALCEGDDFWNEPDKLQQQVDYLEAHPDCALCCSDAHVLSANGELAWNRFPRSRRISAREAIMKAGLVFTASMVYRYELQTRYAHVILPCHVGDYPLQVCAAIHGYIYVIGKKMATYRFAMGASWSATFAQKRNVSINLRAWRSELTMLDEANRLSKGRYARYFLARKGRYCRYLMKRHPYMAAEIKALFEENIATHNRDNALSLPGRMLEACHKRLILWWRVSLPYRRASRRQCACRGASA